MLDVTVFDLTVLAGGRSHHRISHKNCLRKSISSVRYQFLAGYVGTKSSEVATVSVMLYSEASL
jgi:hypothetical protein